MNSEEAAQTMVTYYSSVTALIRNHPVFMQYSNHKELKTDNSPNQVVRQAATAAPRLPPLKVPFSNKKYKTHTHTHTQRWEQKGVE